MGKILFLLGIGLLIYLLLKTYHRNLQNRKPDAPPKPAAENMVRCAQCGVNVPQSEAIFSRGQHYCSNEHRQQHQH